MATSGSTNFTIQRDQLIKDAFVKINALALGQTPSSTEINHAARQLNMMLKAWMVDGLQVWQRRTKSITLVASKAAYTMGLSGYDVTIDRPHEIVEATIKVTSSSTETPLIPISRNEYEQLANKTSTGTPTQYHYQPNIVSGTLYIWPTASSSVASTQTLEIVYQKPIDDMDTAANEFDVPPEWYQAILYGLAYNLSFDYGMDAQEQRILYLAYQNVYNRALDSVVEPSVFLQPDSRNGY